MTDDARTTIAIEPIAPEEEAVLRAWVEYQLGGEAGPKPPLPKHDNGGAGLWASLLAEIDRLRSDATVPDELTEGDRDEG